tara:strand:- start:312 stop:659 length:348 start_codon:yes stop_codon:yes gene_type:complete
MSKKTARIEFRCTPEQKEELLEVAASRDMTVTELIIQQCLEHPEDKYCRYCFDPIAEKNRKTCECYKYKACTSCQDRVPEGEGVTVYWEEEPTEDFWCENCEGIYAVPAKEKDNE